MSDISRTSGVHSMKMQQTPFLAAIWSFLAIAIISASLRFLARLRTFKKFLVDDYFVLAAVVFAIANAVVWQITAPKLYIVMDVAAGLALPDADFKETAESYFKTTIGVIWLYYSALWAIKLSFLLLFKRLGNNVNRQKWLWWPIFVYTMATYFVCVGVIQYDCLATSFEHIVAYCGTAQSGEYMQLTLKLNCAWDVTSDFFIMLLPLHLLRGVQMRLGRKLALMGLFSLAIVTIIVGILRTALVSSRISSTIPDSTLLYMWSAVEVSIAITIASLASFRNLFSRDNTRYTPPTPVKSSNVFMRGSGARAKLAGIIDTLASVPEERLQSTYRGRTKINDDSYMSETRRADSYEEAIDMTKNVTVTREVALTHSFASTGGSRHNEQNEIA